MIYIIGIIIVCIFITIWLLLLVVNENSMSLYELFTGEKSRKYIEMYDQFKKLDTEIHYLDSRLTKLEEHIYIAK